MPHPGSATGLSRWCMYLVVCDAVLVIIIIIIIVTNMYSVIEYSLYYMGIFFLSFTPDQLQSYNATRTNAFFTFCHIKTFATSTLS